MYNASVHGVKFNIFSAHVIFNEHRLVMDMKPRWEPYAYRKTFVQLSRIRKEMLKYISRMWVQFSVLRHSLLFVYITTLCQLHRSYGKQTGWLSWQGVDAWGNTVHDI